MHYNHIILSLFKWQKQAVNCQQTTLTYLYVNIYYAERSDIVYVHITQRALIFSKNKGRN